MKTQWAHTTEIGLMKIKKGPCGTLSKPTVEKLLENSCSMEQRALQNENSCLNTNIYSYLETSGGQSSNLYLNAVHFFNTSVN